MYKTKFPKLRIFDIEICPHDILWLSSTDFSGQSTTEPIIHNFALSYAMSRFNRVLSSNTGPTYDEDLAKMNWYATPARALRYRRFTVTWNAIDDWSFTTEDKAFNKKNTPKLGTKIVLAPFPSTSFYGTVFSLQGEEPPRIIRLGKKRTPCLVKTMLEWDPSLIREYEVLSPTHVVNPIDVEGEIQSYRIVAIPPSLLSDDVTILRGIGIVKHERAILIPKCLLA